jgi:hypothetical protein
MRASRQVHAMESGSSPVRVETVGDRDATVLAPLPSDIFPHEPGKGGRSGEALV